MLFYKPLAFYYFLSLLMLPPNSFYRLSSQGFCHIYFPKNKAYLADVIFPGMLCFTSPKKKRRKRKKKSPGMMQAQRSLPSDCSCHEAQCNHTEETRRRTHVIMINPRLGKTCGRNLMSAHRRLSRQWSRMSAALSDVSCLGTPQPSDRLTNRHTPAKLTEQQFTILSDKPRCLQSPYMCIPVGGIKCWLSYSWKP